MRDTKMSLGGGSRSVSVAAAVLAFALSGFAGRAAAQENTTGKRSLTVERIYGQPSLSGRLSRGIEWSPDGKTLTFFVSSVEFSGSVKHTRVHLAAMDASTGQRHELVSADNLERMQPEKKGPTSQATGLGRHAPAQYEWAPDGSALLFVSPKALVWFDLKSEAARTLATGKDALADAKISPNGKFVSFVRDHNLFVVNVEDSKEHALTTGGTEQVRKGELDWVYPEELELTTAYWWAPDSSQVAFLEMDEREVNRYPLVDFASPTGEAAEERYPVAGGKNPVVHVYTVGVNGGEPRLMDTGADTNTYTPRVKWMPDAKHLAIQRLNRGQTQLDLLEADAGTGTSRVILTEKDPRWINIGDELDFLRDGQRFLWASERSGYRHLYLYDLQGKELAQLTRGDWEVTNLDSLDEAHGLVYFTATKESPTERQIYSVGMDGSGLARVTKTDGTHAGNFSPDASAFVDTYSRAGLPPSQMLLRKDGTEIAAINENKVAELAEYNLSPVQFLKVKAKDGAELNAYVIKPAGFDAGKKYPVLVYTYGGPHAQVVLNSWGGPTFLWHEMLTQKGFVIFALDNRGSAGRGHVFESPIYHHFGDREISDQEDGVAWLKKQPWVDASRIGVWGWSYGGHMTLQLMFRDAKDFKAGFAGGPVTDWHYYDSIYTERYMGLPQDNEENYVKSSPATYAGQLTGKLLIAHGTGDDNVHFANTLTLIDHLLDKGKYVEVMPFPGRGHGVSDAAARTVLMKRVTEFFEKNLLGE